MKYFFRRILSLLLSISILLVSLFIFPVSVFAFSPSDFIGNLSWDKMTDTEKWALTYNFVVSEARALYQGNFEDYVNGMSAMEEFKSTHTPDDFVTDTGLSIPADFTALIKQALIEYSEETNGFYIVRTTPFSSIDPQQFTYKAAYTTLSHLVNQCKLISVNGGATCFYVTSLSSVYDNGYSFVYPSSTIDTPRSGGFAYLYDDNWTRRTTAPMYWFSFTQDTPAYGSLASGDLAESPGHRVTQHSAFSPNYCLVNHGRLYNGYSNIYTAPNGCLISNDGRNVRVFKNLDAFKLYTTNNRSVYFAKDFYESDPGDITATWDEIADSVANIDKSFQDLLDRIDSTTDESTIEDLLQQILDSINGGGSGTGTGSGSGGGSSLPEGWCDDILIYLDRILEQLKSIKSDSVIGGGGNTVAGGSAPEHWYDDILSYLDRILDQLKSIKRWTAIDTVIDGVDAIADWFDLIHDILSDVDDGMESAVSTLSSALDDAAGLLKTKFPFSVPWDIFFFVTLLAAEPEVPRFEVPIDFGVSAIDMHVHYDFVVDFTDYQYLSDIFRVILSMTYAVGLLKMTAGIVSTRKEE